MITGGFQHEYAWKNYPVCLDCALNIREGYNFLKEHFNFKFYGLRYYFIPKISDKNLYNDTLDLLLRYKNNPKFKSEDINRLTNDENDIFEYLQEESSNISFTLFFYDMPQKAVLRILALIEDILPSRLHKLFDAKKFVDEIVFFKEAKSKKDERLCYFNFGIVRNFFPNSKIEGNKDKNFLEVTEKIFKNKPIDNKFIIQNIMAKIKPKFARGESTWLDTLKGFMFFLYLIKLKLIKRIKEEKMDKQFFEEFKIQTKKELESKVELFFNNFKDFFQTDAHRSIFLIGVLSQYLLNIQQRDRGATPFRSKLKGLKMNAYDISVLLPEAIEKLEEYGKNYYQPLEELISKYLISAGHYTKWRLPIDEMNFIFGLGMNLSKYFKIKLEEIEEEQND
jgi:CRISPR-associated protein Csh1